MTGAIKDVCIQTWRWHPPAQPRRADDSDNLVESDPNVSKICPLGHQFPETSFVCPQCGMAAMPTSLAPVSDAAASSGTEPVVDPVVDDPTLSLPVDPASPDPAAATMTPPTPVTPLLSPDGQWAWDGTQWLPAPPAAATPTRVGEIASSTPETSPAAKATDTPATNAITLPARTRKGLPKAALAAAAVLVLGASGVGVAAAMGVLSPPARHGSTSAAATPALPSSPTAATDPGDPDYQAGVAYANSNNADWLAFFGRVGGNAATSKSDRDTDILGWCTQVDPFLGGDEAPGSRLVAWRDGCIASFDSSSQDTQEVPADLPQTGDTQVDTCQSDVTTAMADGFAYVDQNDPGRTVPGGPLLDDRSRGDFAQFVGQSIARTVEPLQATGADYSQNQRLIALLNGAITQTSLLMQSSAVNNFQLSNARRAAQIICVAGTKANPPVVTLPGTATSPASPVNVAPGSATSYGGVWNTFPHPWLDCTAIGLDNRTQVDAVEKHTISGTVLTFVHRDCLTGDGTGNGVVAVYTGTPEQAHLVGVLLKDSDGASSVQVTVSEDLISASATMRKPDDPGCCPSGHIVRRYRFQQGQLTSA